MVTTTVGMLNGVHGNTSHSWPVVPLSLCLVPGSVGLGEACRSSGRQRPGRPWLC